MIVAADEKDLIGRDNALPWYLPDDLRHFKQLTTGHVLVAGRRTHDSIMTRAGRTLPNRFTVVVSRHPHPAVDGAVFVPDVPSALRVATDISTLAGLSELFVIGGATVYQECLPKVDRVRLTRVHQVVEGDVRMPDGWLDGFTLTASEPHDGFTFEDYER